MMSIRFYFVRHGQSEANLRDEYYNDEDAKLTQLGKKQAAKAGYKLRDYGVQFKVIFCSPYKRAMDTCRIAMQRAGMYGMLVAVDERLGERKFDGLVGCKIDEKHNRELYDYNSSRSKIDGVETLESMELRAMSFIDEITKNYNEGNVLVFSHGVFGLVFRAVLLGRPESDNLFDWRILKNGEIMVLEV